MSAAGAPLQSQARQYQQIAGKGRELQVLLEVLPAFPVAAVQPEDALEHRDTAFDAGPKAAQLFVYPAGGDHRFDRESALFGQGQVPSGCKAPVLAGLTRIRAVLMAVPI